MDRRASESDTGSAPARNEVPPGGRVEIADHAIASIVHGAVLACYGVVDMAPRSIGSAIGKRLGRSNPGRGIAVRVADGRITVDLSVIVEYGTPVFTVAKNVMQTVKFQVERTLGMPVERVNVSVEGLRVSPGSAGGATAGRGRA